MCYAEAVCPFVSLFLSGSIVLLLFVIKEYRSLHEVSMKGTVIDSPSLALELASYVV